MSKHEKNFYSSYHLYDRSGGQSYEQKKFTDFNGDGSTGNYRCGDHNY